MTLIPQRSQSHSFSGGLDLESPALSISPGSLILCQNYEAKAGGGYTRIGGYERFDGQPSPTSAEDSVAARALIAAVPGSGKILGVQMFQGNVYAFRNTADGLAAKMYKSTASGWEEVTTPVLAPNGKYEFINHNFYGATSLQRMYGVDGVNKAFMYDGTTFTQLIPAGTTTEPRHIAAHSNHLFLSYDEGQYLHSGIGEPNAWDVATDGAGTGGTGDDIVGMRTTVGGALAFFMRNKVAMLYGSSKADWTSNDLRKQQDQAGSIEHSIQDLGDMFYLDDRGITTLQQTQAFGNFDSATIDKQVKRFVQIRKNKLLGSAISRSKGQYLLYFNQGNATELLSLTMSQSIDGYGRSIYPFILSAVCSSEDESGTERIFAGANDGFIYELNMGTSFDGGDIESYIKPAFSSFGMPNKNKRFRSAIFGLESENNLTLRIKPEFDYGSIERSGHRVIDGAILGGGGQWNNDNWNEFAWSAQIVSETKIDITGTGKNMALLIYHKGADTKPFTVYDVTIQYSIRGIVR